MSELTNKHRKIFLIFGISANLSLLGVFKYSDFFIENFNYLFTTQISVLNLTLPLAISFFTFQQITYLVDGYRQKFKKYDFLDYAAFVTFFPQLIAGPIVHYKEMMPQFSHARSKIINYKNISSGLFIFSIGLFKKVVIADSFAQWANAGFAVTEALNLYESWLTSLSYTFQLYFDFSGYSDMAIGLALLFNIRFPINFNSPYKALNIQDFWRRWHITLSRFLKDYIYIPLGGNKFGQYATYNNLLITFVLGGIWHGASWMFVFWGFLHGAALVIHRMWGRLGYKLWRWVAWLVTFNFINIAWVFFRAKEWADAIKILKGMFGLSEYDLMNFSDMAKHIGGSWGWQLIGLVVGFLLVLANSNSIAKMQRLKFNYPTAIFAGIASSVALIFMSLHEVSDFLYFNF